VLRFCVSRSRLEPALRGEEWRHEAARCKDGLKSVLQIFLRQRRADSLGLSLLVSARLTSSSPKSSEGQMIVEARRRAVAHQWIVATAIKSLRIARSPAR